MAYPENWRSGPGQPVSGDPRHGRTATVPWWQRPSRGIVWVALTALSFGLLAPFTFTYAAAKRRSVITVIAAILFIVLSGLLWTAPDDSRLLEVALGVNIVASICAALALRPHVFRGPEPTPDAPTSPTFAAAPTTAGPESQPWPGPAHSTIPAPTHGGMPVPPPAPAPAGAPDPAATNAQLWRQAEDRRARRAEARTLAAQNPAGAVELGIGRPDRHTGYDDGGLIDLNRAPASVLSHLPGLDQHHVDALLRSRTEIGPFVSFADAVIRADIPPHLENEVAEYAIVF